MDREAGAREWAELLEVLAYVVCGEDSHVTEDLFTTILTSRGVSTLDTTYLLLQMSQLREVMFSCCNLLVPLLEIQKDQMQPKWESVVLNIM